MTKERVKLLCMEDYTCGKHHFLRGLTYTAEVRNNPLFGRCFYILRESEEYDPYRDIFFKENHRSFKELASNSIEFLLEV